MRHNNNGQSQQLFDLAQRNDGAWNVWVRKSLLELGMVDREAIEAARGQAFDQDGWDVYTKLPHVTEPTVWVIVAVYSAKPATQDILALLGVKQRPRDNNQDRRGPRPSRPRREAEAA